MADNDSLLNEALGDPAVLVSLFVVLVLDAFLNATSVPRLSKHPHDHLFFFFFLGCAFTYPVLVRSSRSIYYTETTETVDLRSFCLLLLESVS